MKGGYWGKKNKSELESFFSMVGCPSKLKLNKEKMWDHSPLLEFSECSRCR